MIDTHTHSHHSPDGAAAMITMVESARDIGLTGITFTEHGEWYPGDEAYGYLNLEAYFAELNEVRTRFSGTMTVLAGIELGNPHDFPDLADALLAQHPFDLVIGSVHWLDNQPGWQPPIFEPGIENTYRRYFEEVAKMVASAEFDVLGHLDLIRRDSWELLHETLPLDSYWDLIDYTLKQLVENGRGLEVNTSGLRKGLPEPVPGEQVLRRFRELGGEILVFGSDGHRPEHVGYGFDVAREFALRAGFVRVPRFERRQVAGWIEL